MFSAAKRRIRYRPPARVGLSHSTADRPRSPASPLTDDDEIQSAENSEAANCCAAGEPLLSTAMEGCFVIGELLDGPDSRERRNSSESCGTHVLKLSDVSGAYCEGTDLASVSDRQHNLEIGLLYVPEMGDCSTGEEELDGPRPRDNRNSSESASTHVLKLSDVSEAYCEGTAVASVGDRHRNTETGPLYIPATGDCSLTMDAYYSARIRSSRLRHCTDVRGLAHKEAKAVMGARWNDMVDLVLASQRSIAEKSTQLINSAVELVRSGSLSQTTIFTREEVHEWLQLGEGQEAVTGNPSDTACTALCVALPGEVQRGLECVADCGSGDLRNGVNYLEAIQRQRLVKPGDFVSTYRLVLERDALRVHMQCIEVLVGPDTFTVCKKMFNVQNIQWPKRLLKGIVLSEGCGSCQVVVHSSKFSGSVQTPPVTEPEHIAACLVLALHYTGVELLRLLQKWHYDQTGLLLHPLAPRPVSVTQEKANALNSSPDSHDSMTSSDEDDESEDDESEDDGDGTCDVCNVCTKLKGCGKDEPGLAEL
jgi:hypothetical protein